MESTNFFALKEFDCIFLRWLDWIFMRGYLPSLSINYVATSKDMGKRLPQLYYIKMKISGFYCNRSRHGNITMPLRFLFIFVFLCTGSFIKKSLRARAYETWKQRL